MRNTRSFSSIRNEKYLEKNFYKKESKTRSYDDLESISQENEEEKILSRISWFDANLALNEIYNQKLIGNETALKIKSKFQSLLYDLGIFIQKNAGIVLFFGFLFFIASSIGIKFISYENNFENLWVEQNGRVEQELNFIRKTLGEGLSNSNQILIQTPNKNNINILNTKSLLLHLELMQIATQVTVDLFDITWKLKDICYSLTPPDIEEYTILQTIEKMLPCLIVTPLDCFWEGSKILGPDDEIRIPGIDNLKWTNINPKQLISSLQENEGVMRQSRTKALTESFMDIFKKGGITSGYQEKYCLNPSDDECPKTAPNKNSNLTLDIGAVLTGGCYGFADKWLHWPEQLILGAVTKNRDGKIVHAGSLQSIIQLMSDQNLFEFYQNHFKVISILWTRDKAKLVLEAWQKKLSEEVQRFSFEDQFLKESSFFQFTSISLMEIMKNFNYINLNRVGISIGLVILYTIICSVISNEKFKPHFITEIAGFLLIIMSTISGFGLCALVGLTFNANSMHIVPYLSFGIGIYLVNLLKIVYGENLKLISFDKFDLIARCLQQIGITFFICGQCIIISFLLSALIPIPVLRIFIYQTTILISYLFMTIIILYPAILSFDSKRFVDKNIEYYKKNAKHENRKSNNSLKEKNLEDKIEFQEKNLSCSFNFLFKKQIKILIILLFLVSTIYCIIGGLQIKNGLDLTDIVPKNTHEYEFLSIQKQQFNVYNMFLITKGNFDYPSNQKLLYEYYKSFNSINNIIRDNNGGLRDFWLVLFREWLQSLQNAFETDLKNNCFNEDTWYKNASSEAILAFKLLAQTGRNDNPIDRRHIFKNKKLVDGQGIINTKAFYNYLTAWVSNDAFTFSASHVVFKPEPKQWTHDSSDYDLKIPKSQPLVYTQTSFLLGNLDSTESILKTIEEVRFICDSFSKKGLNNFPTGLPFVFYEQYVNLKVFLTAGLFFSLVFTLFITMIFFFSFYPSIFIVICLVISKIQIFGIMGHLGIKLNAIPTTVLILSTGISASNFICFMIHFMSCLNDSKEERVKLTMSKINPSIFNGLNLFILNMIALHWSEFNYISDYFFTILLLSYSIDLIQLYLFYPILLSLIGPSCELSIKNDEFSSKTKKPLILNQNKLHNCKKHNYCKSCHEHSSCEINTSSKNYRCKNLSGEKNSYFRKVFPKMNSAISLSTISEESQSSSKEIIVQTKFYLPQYLKDAKTENFNQNKTKDSSKDFNDKESPTNFNDRPDSAFSQTSTSSSFYHPNLLPCFRNLPTPTNLQTQENLDEMNSSSQPVNPPPPYIRSNENYNLRSSHSTFQPILSVNNTFNINL